MCVERFIELVLTTQSYRNASELPLAASVGKKKFFDVGPVAIPKFQIARFGHVPGAKSWKIKKNKGNKKKQRKMEPENKIKLQKARKFNENLRKSPKIHENLDNFRNFQEKSRNPLKIRENPAIFDKSPPGPPPNSTENPPFLSKFSKKIDFFQFFEFDPRFF